MTPLSAREVRRMKAGSAVEMPVLAQGPFLARGANKSNAAA
jgi:hypothetical protein